MNWARCVLGCHPNVIVVSCRKVQVGSHETHSSACRCSFMMETAAFALVFSHAEERTCAGIMLKIYGVVQEVEMLTALYYSSLFSPSPDLLAIMLTLNLDEETVIEARGLSYGSFNH